MLFFTRFVVCLETDAVLVGMHAPISLSRGEALGLGGEGARRQQKVRGLSLEPLR